MKVAPKQRLRIRSEVSGERPTIWIGKSGVTPGVLEKISKQLKKERVVKVKILRSVLRSEEREKIAEIAADATNSALIDVRGRTFVLYKTKART